METMVLDPVCTTTEVAEETNGMFVSDKMAGVAIVGGVVALVATGTIAYLCGKEAGRREVQSINFDGNQTEQQFAKQQQAVQLTKDELDVMNAARQAQGLPDVSEKGLTPDEVKFLEAYRSKKQTSQPAPAAAPVPQQPAAPVQQ